MMFAALCFLNRLAGADDRAGIHRVGRDVRFVVGLLHEGGERCGIDRVGIGVRR